MFAFPPKVLIGGILAVSHYKCFVRILTVLAAKILGIAILNYFVDFGSLVHGVISRLGPETFLRFTTAAGAFMKDDKSDVETSIAFLGLLGDSACPERDMVLYISLRQEKNGRLPQITLDFAREGSIAHKDLVKLIGDLSFTQTSLFGRFGRSLLLSALRDMLKIRRYFAKLYAAGIAIPPLAGSSHLGISREGLRNRTPNPRCDSLYRRG